MFRRRVVVRRAGAPLVRAAVIGGTAYAAGRAGQRAEEREAQEQAAIAELQAQQASNQNTPSSFLGADTTAQLKQLADLKASGALSYEEFEAAKKKLLGL